MASRKICVVTGARSDYGLLQRMMKLIQLDPDLKLQTIVTGMHLSPEFGLTYKQIEDDGFVIDAKIEMLLSSDTAVGITKSIGLGIIGFAEALDRLKPDILVLLGDRFETLAAAQAALVAKIPIAHIAGGDTTEGAFDESIRHSVTKMSHLHFVTNEEASRRVCQLGENPFHIFNVGSPGIDQIRTLELLSKSELERVSNFKFRTRNFLITFHPVTLDHLPSDIQFQQLLEGLKRLGQDVGLFFTKPNADNDGRLLIQLIDQFVAENSNAIAFTSLGQLKYLSMMAESDVVVGNSSSGLYEAPSFKKPTVNIGDRQKGRIMASSVINCEPKADEIFNAIHMALNMDCSNTVNPYGDGHSSERIVHVLKTIPDFASLLKKHFHIGGLSDGS